MDNIRKEVNKVNNAIKQKRMVSSYSVFFYVSFQLVLHSSEF